MPELPEVETTRRGIEPHIINQTIDHVVVREPRLRWDIPSSLTTTLAHQQIKEVTRRGKYLLLATPSGTLIIHLGMSGCLSILKGNTPVKTHDHVDICLDNNTCLRYNDPRRFGAILWTTHKPEEHKLLSSLGVEPLTAQFNPAYLIKEIKNSVTSIKSWIMNAHHVVGVGNIYANEALFLAKISPLKRSKDLTPIEARRLCLAIKICLQKAIQQGGTTLKDFQGADGQPGYFSQQLNVYGRNNEPCYRCAQPIKKQQQQQRSTFYCSTCQQ